MPCVRRILAPILAILFAVAAPALAQDKPIAARKPLRFWVQRLYDSDPKVRERAAKSMELGDFRFVLDEEAARMRAAIRREAKPLIPELLTAIKSTDEEVVLAAAGVLMLLGPEAQVGLPDVEKIVLDHKTTAAMRMSMFHVLLFVTPEDQPVGPTFLKILNSFPKETLRKYFDFGEHEKQSGDDKGGQSANERKWRGTIVGLWTPAFAGPLMYSGHTKIEVPYLVKIALGDYPSTIRALAVSILGQLGFEAKSAVPALRKLLKDEDRFVRHWAANSLLTIEPDPKLVPEVIEALELKGKEREKVEKAMREYPEQQKRERESDRELFSDEDDFTFFIQMLKFGNGYYRRQAIQYLGSIGPAANSAVPELRKALRDPDADTRRMAAEALRQIDPQSAKRDGN